MVNSWSFGQLHSFIEYKAVRAGIKIASIQPIRPKPAQLAASAAFAGKMFFAVQPAVKAMPM